MSQLQQTVAEGEVHGDFHVAQVEPTAGFSPAGRAIVAAETRLSWVYAEYKLVIVLDITPSMATVHSSCVPRIDGAAGQHVPLVDEDRHAADHTGAIPEEPCCCSGACTREATVAANSSGICTGAHAQLT